MMKKKHRDSNILLRKKIVYLPLEMVFILENGVVVGVHPNAVAEHLFLVVEEAIGAEIVSEINALVHGAVRGGGAASHFEIYAVALSAV